MSYHLGRRHCMNKSELIDAIAKDAKISKNQASEVMNALEKNVQSALSKGDKVTLVGFGTFSVSQRAERTGRNPQTGKPIKIAAKKVVRFAPGKALKDAIAK
ncbi:MAG TPA: HU family DNA-binding protein [Acidobacteriota bacterium]|nr:HU family DNA-binding protein [Acidobacteriota bacterium]